MNLASHADVRTGAETREEPLRTSARETTMNEDRHFSFGRDDNILALSTLNLRGPALGRPTYSSFFRRFLFSHCLLNVEYKTIGVQKREFLSKKYYCCRTLEVVPKSYRPKGQPRSTRNEFPIRADFGNSRKHGSSSVVKTDSQRSRFIAREAWFTVMLTQLAFILSFEVFFVLYSKQSFYKCLVNLQRVQPYVMENRE